MDVAEWVDHLFRAWPVLLIIIGWLFRVEMLLRNAHTREAFKDAMILRDELLERRYMPRELLSERLANIEKRLEEITQILKSYRPPR